MVNSLRFQIQSDSERAKSDLERLQAIHAKLANQEVLTKDELSILSQQTLQNPKPGYNPHLRYVPGDLQMNSSNFRRLEGWWIAGNLEVNLVDKPDNGLVLNDVFVGGDCLISGNKFAYTDMSEMEIEGRWIYRNNANEQTNNAYHRGVIAHGALMLQKELRSRESR